DGDLKSDILWRHDSGQVYLWEMNGLNIKRKGTMEHAAVPTTWHVEGLADFDGDGSSDILWRHDNGQVYVWEMNGLNIKWKARSRTPAFPTTGKSRASATSMGMARVTSYGATTAGRSTSGR